MSFTSVMVYITSVTVYITSVIVYITSVTIYITSVIIYITSVTMYITSVIVYITSVNIYITSVTIYVTSVNGNITKDFNVIILVFRYIALCSLNITNNLYFMVYFLIKILFLTSNFKKHIMAQGTKLRMEEYVTAGTFLKTSFVRDRAELLTRFSEFTADFETEFLTQLAKVDTLEQTLKLSKEQKQMTFNLYEAADALNKELNFLTFYFKGAGLEMDVLTQLKYDLRVKNIEGACYKMEGLIQYVAENETILVSKGMEVGFANVLTTIKNNLAVKNASQNEIMNIKKQLHEDNAIEYKKLYTYISSIVSAGKIMYSSFGKVDEYTITRLVSRMRVVKKETAMSEAV